jgi:branched-chain amino acid transport system ATP-binding protein
MDRVTETALLEAESLTVVYRGAGIGVSGISLRVGANEVVCLLGPNGAGKSSTLRALAGFLRRDTARLQSGRITFKEHDITHISPRARARLGLGMAPEREKIFTELTVAENLKITSPLVGRQVFNRQRELALEVFPALRSHLTRRAGYLSGGQRQMLALASTLCANPTVLLVDELTLGLAPELVRSMTDSLKRLVQEGLTVVMAEQNVNVGLELSDTVHVLDGGREVTSGPPGVLKKRAEISSAYLGKS